MRRYLLFVLLLLSPLLIVGCGPEEDHSLHVHRGSIMTDHLMVGPIQVIRSGREVLVLTDQTKVQNVTGAPLGFVSGEVTVRAPGEDFRFHGDHFFLVDEPGETSHRSYSQHYSDIWKGDRVIEELLIEIRYEMDGSTYTEERLLVLEETEVDYGRVPEERKE